MGSEGIAVRTGKTWDRLSVSSDSRTLPDTTLFITGDFSVLASATELLLS